MIKLLAEIAHPPAGRLEPDAQLAAQSPAWRVVSGFPIWLLGLALKPLELAGFLAPMQAERLIGDVVFDLGNHRPSLG